MIEVRGKLLTEAAEEVMEECYMKASGNNTLPAGARQIFYVARPLIEERTEKPLSYRLFQSDVVAGLHQKTWMRTGTWSTTIVGISRSRTTSGSSASAP